MIFRITQLSSFSCGLSHDVQYGGLDGECGTGKGFERNWPFHNEGSTRIPVNR